MPSRFTGAAAGWLAAGALTLLVGAVPAGAQTTRTNLNTNVPGTMGIPQPEPLITLSIKQPRSLARVLYEIFKQTTFEYQLLADVGTTAFTIDVNKVPLTQTLTRLLAQEKRPEPLVYSFQKSLTNRGGTFIIDREYIEIGVFEDEKKVSLANARITRVLPELFKLMGVKGRVEPDVPPVTVTVQLRPDDWSNVLPQLMLEASKKEPALTYSKAGDTLVVHVQRTPSGAPGSPLPSGAQPRRVKLAVSDMRLPDALAQLFQGSTWKYQVADSLKDVTVSYTTANEPELAALYSMLRTISAQGGEQVTYREGKGTLYIEPGPLPGQFVVAAKQPTVRRTNLNASRTKLKQVCDLVGGALGTKITVAPNVPDILISVKLTEASIDDAMAAIIAAARESLPNIGFRAVAGGFVVELR